MLQRAVRRPSLRERMHIAARDPVRAEHTLRFMMSPVNTGTEHERAYYQYMNSLKEMVAQNEGALTFPPDAPEWGIIERYLKMLSWEGALLPTALVGAQRELFLRDALGRIFDSFEGELFIDSPHIDVVYPAGGRERFREQMLAASPRYLGPELTRQLLRNAPTPQIAQNVLWYLRDRDRDEGMESTEMGEPGVDIPGM